MTEFWENTDTWLVERVLEGDEEAFSALYRKYQTEIYRYLAGLTTPSEAEDLLQEIFLKAFARIKSLKEPAKFRHWLYKVARNHTYDYLRRKPKYIVQSIESLQELEEPMTDNDSLEELFEQELVRQVLTMLPIKFRDCLLLKIIGGFSKQEIASLVHITEQSVTTYLCNARRKFREEYLSLKKQAMTMEREASNED
jgi:RNA polymerase sigma-70 factor, ECF subfamily